MNTFTPPNGDVTTAASAAAYYLAHNIATVPNKAGGKIPWDYEKNCERAAWPRLRFAPEAINDLFPPGANIGVLLGAPSRGLVDTDLDAPEARRAAGDLLPATGMIGGRSSATDSHFFYIADDPPRRASQAFKDPVTATKLLELRSTGGQTLIAPSIYAADPGKGHPTAEPFVWRKRCEPARVSTEVLWAKIRAVAAAALLGRYWPRSCRHDAALAVAGGLRRASWPQGEALRLVAAIGAAADDEEPDDRASAVRSTYEAGEAEALVGWPKLKAILGERGDTIVETVLTWLNIRPTSRGTFGSGREYDESPRTRHRYRAIPEYVPFPTDCLPAPWDAFVREGAAALRCDEALVALPVLAVLASAIGNTRRIHLGAEWVEPAILWTCVIADSGSMKTSAANLSVDLVRARQKRLMKEFMDAMHEYQRQMAERKSTEEPPDDEPSKPTLERVVVADVTVEKLAGLHDDNRRGLLVARDELAGWFGSFSKYKGKGGGTDEPNWLSMHRGDAIVYDRKTGDKTSIFVPHAATSVTGGIQPGVLRRLASHDLFESGMVARIVFSMPPRTPKTWSDDEIPAETKEAAKQSLDALYELRGAVDENDDLCPIVVKLDREAKQRLKRFVNEWGVRQFEADGERAAALAKLEALPGRFALIRHLVRTVGTPEERGPVGLNDLEAGIRLAEWCARETERVYSLLAESAEETQIRKLVELVTRLAARNDGRVTVKVLQRANQRKYVTANLARLDLQRLVDLGLGEWEAAPKRPTGGWTPSYFTLRPRPSVARDSSNSCAEDGDTDGDPPACDGRPGGPPNAPAPPDPPSGASDEPTSGCAENGERGGQRGNETSRVTQDRDAENHAPEEVGAGEVESHTSCGSRVTQATTATPYTRIATPAEVADLAEALARRDGPLAIDCETTGLNPLTDRVRLIQVAGGDDVGIIDLFALSDPVADLAPLFAVTATKELVGHNIQFDLRMLARYGFSAQKVFDTMLASRVLHAGDREEGGARLRHGLGDVVERELGRSLDKLLQTADWSGALTAAHLAYAAADALVLVPLADALRAKLAGANLTRTADREMRAVPGVAWARPVSVNRAAWLALADEAEAAQARLAEAMDALAPNGACLPGAECRNWDSPAQVKAAFASLGIDLAATDDDTLAGVDHPLAGLLRDYRAAAKRSGAYGRGWLDKHLGADDQVLPSWNQLGTESGRMSCSDPNLQQIPRGSEYRKCFIARPGHVLVKADYSQVELRIAAKVAKEAVMFEAYRDGRDLHTLTAARVLNKPEAEVTKADRQLAKAVNFGLLYGMGWKGLKKYAKANYGVELTDAQAQNYRATFFETYPALRKWHATTEASVKRLFRKDPAAMHPAFTLGGRRRLLPVAKRSRDGEPYANKTDALNSPVQGTGADGLKDAIALLWERRAECPSAVPVVFCHDEIVLDVPEGDAGRAAEWLKRCMTEPMAALIDPVPIEVEVSVGRTWGG